MSSTASARRGAPLRLGFVALITLMAAVGHYPPSNCAILVGLSAARTGISTADLRVLINGTVFAPGLADYDSARSVFYGEFGRHSAAIVRAVDAADVAGTAWRATARPTAAGRH